MKTITIAPADLPALDIVALANDHRIVRAERDTPQGAIPAFITGADWHALVAQHHAAADASHRVLNGLEKAVPRLLAHIGSTLSPDVTPKTSFTLQTDLFGNDAPLVVAFVRDATHNIACTLIGSPGNMQAVLRSVPVEASDSISR